MSDVSLSVINPVTLAQLYLVASCTPPGIFVELGVYKGGSARILADVAESQGRELHLFDTFTGMPFQHTGDSHKVGDFADTDESSVRALIPSAIFHVGVFPQTMPGNLKPIAFCHIDADQYQSYVDAIALFSPLMVKGGIMWFDDCDSLESATKAVNEAFGDRVIRGEMLKPIVRF
ncbi:TylF/MycF/NovP-related O-methyltransferase [Sphingomonas sp.]|jgi:predicted O-methyltransferase YrrM|uniref:TylF/MycF/NovP-related O-methyltransferase n=1 Tax=Sphingomonas sp. TaxID=28214 RepID=UPI003567B156